MQEAFNKIQGEMEKFKSNPLAQKLGEYLAKECMSNEAVAKQVVKNGKTLEDLAKHITAYAKKKAKSGMAMIPREEVYGEALKFYGTKATGTKSAETAPKPPKTVTKKAKTKLKNDELEKGQVTLFELSMGV